MSTESRELLIVVRKLSAECLQIGARECESIAGADYSPAVLEMLYETASYRVAAALINSKSLSEPRNAEMFN